MKTTRYCNKCVYDKTIAKVCPYDHGRCNAEPNRVIKSDAVNHPPHYTQGGVECIDAIKAATGAGFDSYCVGNAIKYLWRYRHKNGVQDLEKARWYLDRLILEQKAEADNERS